MANLDKLAAAQSQKLLSVIGKPIRQGCVKSTDADNLCTKALGVLQENGLYASILYLLYRSGNATSHEGMNAEQRVATQAVADLLGLLCQDQLADFRLCMDQPVTWQQVNPRKSEIMRHMSDTVCETPLEKMLLVKGLWEQMLIYARYGAKASQ